MGFFESPPPPERPPRPPQPEWAGPPDNELGVGVPGNYLIVRTDEVAIAIQNITAFSSGFSFVRSARLRPGVQLPHQRGLLGATRSYGDESDALLRFGVQFADGRKATNVGQHLVAEPGDPAR